MTSGSVGHFVRQCIPPILMPYIRSSFNLFRKTTDGSQASAELDALQTAFERLNEGAEENEIRFRKDIRFSIHPESRMPFEMFCFRSVEMVEEMDAFIAGTKGKHCLLDVGALHGVFSLVFAAINHERKVVSVDPSPIAFAKLLYNVRKNGLQSDVDPHEVALSSNSGILQMQYQWEHSIAAPLSEPGERLSVEKVPGDVLCQSLGFKPDVIKIDVEGHELKVVTGLSQTISLIKPLVFLEVHPELIMRENDNMSDLWKFFDGAGYRAKKLDGRPMNLEELQSLRNITRMILEPVGA